MVAAVCSREATGVRARRTQSGQVIVETALVMPLFVFIVLGLIQLGLMNQARLLTKYAAYKAVRAGALHSANTPMMEMAALSVVAPMASRSHAAALGNGNIEQVFHITDGSSFSQVMGDLNGNMMAEGNLQYVKVVICNPTTEVLNSAGGQQLSGASEPQYDFDDARNAGGTDWKPFMRTKLVAQVTFNYRMMIPFANMMLFYIATGQEKAELFRVSRLTVDETSNGVRAARADPYLQFAQSHKIYVLPIRAAYEMRMQSNFFPNKAGFELPASNDCVVFFPRKDGAGSTGGTGTTPGGDATNPDEGGDPGDPG